MNKQEASKFLGVSEKTIERYKAAGRIAAKTKRVIGTDGRSRHILDFNESDLERLKRQLDHQTVYPSITVGHDRTRTSTDIDGQTANFINTELELVSQSVRQPNLVTILQQISTVFERQLNASDRAHRLMLDLRDASIISGLSKSYLKSAIKEGTLKAKLIGRGWKVKRSDLDQFISDL